MKLIATMTEAEEAQWEMFWECDACGEVIAVHGIGSHRRGCHRPIPPAPTLPPVSPDCPMCGRRMMRRWDEYECLVHGTSYGRREPTAEDAASLLPAVGKTRTGRAAPGGKML